MKLTIPIIYQEKNSCDCGPACVNMILQYYEQEQSVEQITDKISVYQGIGSYAPQLGIYLLQQGFDVTIITLNPHLFSTYHINTDQDSIKSHIDHLLQDPKKEKIQQSLIYFQKFLEQGGIITPQIPTQEHIEHELSQHRPLMVLLTSNFLSKDASKFNFHFNVITGLENNTIYVNDPDQSKGGGAQSYHIDEFLYGIHASAFGDADNACLITIRKK